MATKNEIDEILIGKGYTEKSRERLISQLQTNASLVVLLADVIDCLMKDQQALLQIFDMKFDGENKFYMNNMKKSASAYHYYETLFTKNYFESSNKIDNEGMEDDAQDLYEIVKLIADHTNASEDHEQVKKYLRKRKCCNHVYED